MGVDGNNEDETNKDYNDNDHDMLVDEEYEEEEDHETDNNWIRVSYDSDKNITEHTLGATKILSRSVDIINNHT